MPGVRTRRSHREVFVLRNGKVRPHIRLGHNHVASDPADNPPVGFLESLYRATLLNNLVRCILSREREWRIRKSDGLCELWQTRGRDGNTVLFLRRGCQTRNDAFRHPPICGLAQSPDFWALRSSFCPNPHQIAQLRSLCASLPGALRWGFRVQNELEYQHIVYVHRLRRSRGRDAELWWKSPLKCSGLRRDHEVSVGAREADHELGACPLYEPLNVY